MKYLIPYKHCTSKLYDGMLTGGHSLLPTCTRGLKGGRIVVQARAEAHVRDLGAPTCIQQHVMRLQRMPATISVCNH